MVEGLARVDGMYGLHEGRQFVFLREIDVSGNGKVCNMGRLIITWKGTTTSQACARGLT